MEVLGHEVSGSDEVPGEGQTSVKLAGYLAESGVEDIEALATAWAQCSSRGPSAEPFLQPYWFSAFLQSFSAGGRAVLVTARRGRELIGVLPLVRKRAFFGVIPARTLQSLSGIHSCRFDLCAAPFQRDVAAKKMWEVLREDDSWDVIEALHTPDDGGFEVLSREAAKDGYRTASWPTLRSPYLELSEVVDDPFRNCPRRYANARSRLKSYYKKLETYGTISTTTLQEFDTGFFNSFLEIEAAGWKGKNGGAIGLNPAAIQFYRSALQSAGRAGHLRLHALNVNGTPIAMEIGLQMNKRFYSPKVTYDENFSKCSPGQLLMRATLGELVRDGFLYYDFLGAKARHKLVWASKVRAHSHRYIFRPSVSGRLHHALVSRVAPPLKKLKHAIYGDPQNEKMS